MIGRGRAAVLTIVVMLAGTACATDDHAVLFIENHLDETIDLVGLTPAGETVLFEDLEAGKSLSYDRLGHCLDFVMVARDQDGVELSRSDQPLCRGTTWVVD